MPKVTASGRPLWEVYERLVERDNKKKGGREKVKRFCVGHEDGEFVETFSMEGIARHFAKILNERDQALELLAKATGKVRTGWRPATPADILKLKTGDVVQIARVWGPEVGLKTLWNPGLDDDMKLLVGTTAKFLNLGEERGLGASLRGSDNRNWSWPYECLEVEDVLN